MNSESGRYCPFLRGRETGSSDAEIKGGAGMFVRMRHKTATRLRVHTIIIFLA